MALAVLDLNRAIEFSQADFASGQYTEDELDLLRDIQHRRQQSGLISQAFAAACDRWDSLYYPTEEDARNQGRQSLVVPLQCDPAGQGPRLDQHTADLRRHPGRAAGRAAHREPRAPRRLRGRSRAGCHDRAPVHVRGRTRSASISWAIGHVWSRASTGGPPPRSGGTPRRASRVSTSSISRATCGWAGARATTGPSTGRATRT